MDEPTASTDERDRLRDHARRLRWRLSGAWQLPTFVLTTLAGTLLVHLLPFAGQRIDVVGAFLLCGFANLVILAALAPAAGWLLRRRRPALPRAIAVDRAGAALMGAMLAAFALLGALHHAAVLDAGRSDGRQLAAARAYLERNAPAEYVHHLERPSVWKQADFLYRTCFAGNDPQRNLCVFVDMSHEPPLVTEDPDQQPNSFIAGGDNPGRRGR